MTRVFVQEYVFAEFRQANRTIDDMPYQLVPAPQAGGKNQDRLEIPLVARDRHLAEKLRASSHPDLVARPPTEPGDQGSSRKGGYRSVTRVSA